MANRTRSILLAALLLAAPATLAPASAGPARLVVPTDFATIQEAVDAADEGDTIFILPGTYAEEVLVTKSGITIQGASRESVVLDGGNELGNGIYVRGKRDVTVRSLTVKNYVGNGVYYDGADGFWMYDLHAIDNGVYGLYAIRSIHGEVAYSIGEGSADSGIYVGETHHCYCSVHHNVMRRNNIGYSGTANNYILIADNDVYGNAAGIVMSVLPAEPGIQSHATIVRNHVHDNNYNPRLDPIEHFLTVPPPGIGILIAGGWNNLVSRNLVEGNQLWGVGILWLTTEPFFNRVAGNTYVDNGVDVWWDEGGIDNCFEEAETVSSDPTILPGCDSHNVGVPNPKKLAEVAALYLFGPEKYPLPPL